MVNAVTSMRFLKLMNAMTYDPRVLFGQHLVTLRKKRGWSQEKLALESGLARSYVGGIERGKRNIALINICVLANALEVAPSEMLNFVMDPPEGKPVDEDSV
jgi:transcriptional regulator with XRE-family HTH domain